MQPIKKKTKKNPKQYKQQTNKQKQHSMRFVHITKKYESRIPLITCQLMLTYLQTMKYVIFN